MNAKLTLPISLILFLSTIFISKSQVNLGAYTTTTTVTIQGGDDRILVVHVVPQSGNNTTSVMWNGIALSSYTNGTTPNGERLEMFYYTAGNNASDETATLSITPTPDIHFSTSFTNVDQTNPFRGGPGTSSLAAGGLTQNFGGAIVGNLAYRVTLAETTSNIEALPSQTELVELPALSNTNRFHAAYKQVNSTPTDATGISFSGNTNFVSFFARLHQSGCSTPVICYHDNDSDGYGDQNSIVGNACTTCPLGSVSNGDDCNDNDASIHSITGAEASILGICYSTLEEALSAAISNDIILIHQDITSMSQLIIPENVTINLNAGLSLVNNASLVNMGTINVSDGSFTNGSLGTYSGSGDFIGDFLNHGNLDLSD